MQHLVVRLPADELHSHVAVAVAHGNRGATWRMREGADEADAWAVAADATGGR